MVEEAAAMPYRILSYTWVTGTGPRGGKVNIGKHKYDLLNMMVIEHKAEVVARFACDPLGGKLQVYGLVAKVPKPPPAWPGSTPIEP